MSKTIVSLLSLLCCAGPARADEEKEALKERIADLKNELEAGRKRVEDLTEQRRAMEQELEAARARAMRAADERDRARARAAQFETRLRAMEQDLAQARFENGKLWKAARAERAECRRIVLALGEEARRQYELRRKVRRRLDIAVKMLRGHGQLPPTDASPNGSSEVLAAVVRAKLPAALRDQLATGDTDGDGKPELLDAWGHPIAYLPAGKAAVVVNAKGDKVRVGPATKNPALENDECELVSLGPNGTRDPYDEPGCDDVDTSELTRR